MKMSTPPRARFKSARNEKLGRNSRVRGNASNPLRGGLAEDSSRRTQRYGTKAEFPRTKSGSSRQYLGIGTRR